MWSGPRNISTALLRSFSNRDDTIVYDEPFYSYYLKETGLNHPMRDEIIDFYPTEENEVIKTILKGKKGIYYQKHMTHHILDKTNIEWLEKGTNCFLIRHPSKVINSYIKKNKIYSITDIGFDQMFRLFNYVKKNISKNIVIINADTLLENPEIYIKKLCGNLNIEFSYKMLKWQKGNIKDFGIWYKHWYSSIINSSGFNKPDYEEYKIPDQYKDIYNKSLEIYNTMNALSISL
mgnify:CR=1 FL=1